MKKVISASLLILIILLSACGQQEIETNMSESIPDFEAVTQDNEQINLKDFEGEWLVADLIFTNCTTVCLPMTSNMKILQDKLKEKDLDAHLVSLSVDPERDTPEVLKEYANEYDADLNNWTFLTGYDFKAIKELSIKSFKAMLQEPVPGDDQVMHGTRFYLIDPSGNILKFYSGTEADAIDEIVEDLKRVQ
ncbi:SCO family protein [Virgibacillus sp. W0181]|uniref:SCO family protein n=1 Tax=Virgibacillus sp. W0181 TaxID=3391581 RepID=UPI003F45E55D